MNSTTNCSPQVEANKAAVRHMLARINAGDVEGFTAFLDPNYVRHCQAMPENLQEIRGKEMMSQWLKSNNATFPDYHEELECLVGEGDFVAWRSIGTGTQNGALGPFPATHKRMQVAIIGMHRFEEGKVRNLDVVG